MMTTEQIQARLEAMRQQETYLHEQYLMTRGAVAMLEELLKVDDTAPVSDKEKEPEDERS